MNTGFLSLYRESKSKLKTIESFTFSEILRPNTGLIDPGLFSTIFKAVVPFLVYFSDIADSFSLLAWFG